MDEEDAPPPPPVRRRRAIIFEAPSMVTLSESQVKAYSTSVGSDVAEVKDFATEAHTSMIEAAKMARTAEQALGGATIAPAQAQPVAPPVPAPTIVPEPTVEKLPEPVIIAKPVAVAAEKPVEIVKPEVEETSAPTIVESVADLPKKADEVETSSILQLQLNLTRVGSWQPQLDPQQQVAIGQWLPRLRPDQQLGVGSWTGRIGAMVSTTDWSPLQSVLTPQLGEWTPLTLPNAEQTTGNWEAIEVTHNQYR